MSLESSKITFNLSIKSFIEHIKANNQKQDNGIIWNLLFLYLPPVILLIGTIGNVCSFLIFFKLGHLGNKLKPDILISYSKSFANTMVNVFKIPIVKNQKLDDNNNNNNVSTTNNISCNTKNKMSIGIKPFSSKPKTNNKQKTKTGGLTIYLYLSLLALFDLGVIFFGLLNDWITDLTLFNLKNYSSLICKIFTFVGYICSHCSSSLIVITSSIRFLAVYAPYKASNLTNIKSVKLVSFVLLVIFSLFNLHFFWNMNLEKVNDTLYIIDILKKSNLNTQFDGFLDEIYNELKSYNYTGGGGGGSGGGASSSSNSASNSASSILAKTDYHCEIVNNFMTKTLWPIADKLVYCILPFVFITFFNILIIINISKVQKYKYILYVSKLKNELSYNSCNNLNNDRLILDSQYNNANINNIHCSKSIGGGGVGGKVNNCLRKNESNCEIITKFNSNYKFENILSSKYYNQNNNNNKNENQMSKYECRKLTEYNSNSPVAVASVAGAGNGGNNQYYYNNRRISKNLTKKLVCLLESGNTSEIKEKIIQFKKYHLVGKKFTVMLLGLSFGFLILTLPVVVIYILLEPVKKKLETMDLNESNSSFEWLQNAQKISSLLMYLNHSINFFIYFATSSRFRQQFRKSFLKTTLFKTNSCKLFISCKTQELNEKEPSLYD